MFRFFLFGTLLSLLSSVLFLGYFESVFLLGLLVPVSMTLMYKTNYYVENLFGCVNDMNGILIFLTLSVALLIVVSSWSITSNVFLLLHFSLVVVLILCFFMNNLFFFYVCFEVSLLPILLMIIGWGYQPERLQAGMYMILYTVLGSMPLLLIILLSYSQYCVLNMYMLSNMVIPGFTSYISLGIMAFLVKLPIYSLHVWLPKAHVEAPLAGSMILAGVLLKLGGYGLYLYSNIWFFPASHVFTMLIVCLATWGGLLAALICLCQNDLKAMIAYSSVVHMALVVLGVLSGTSWGYVSALVTMVAHGWTSSGLFLLAYISYEKSHSRSFSYIKGMLSLYPSLTLLWFLLTIVNMSAPPTINLVGELAAVPVAMCFNVNLLVVLLFIFFSSVAYNMYMYTKVNHGPAGMYLVSGKSVNSVAMLSVIGHLAPLFMILNMNFMSFYTVNCM